MISPIVKFLEFIGFTLAKNKRKKSETVIMRLGGGERERRREIKRGKQLLVSI